MAITRTWDETFPPDSQAANLLGQDARQGKQDIRERMEDVLVVAGSWAASGPGTDPVVVPQVLGNVVGKAYQIHWSSFVYFNAASTAAYAVAGGIQIVRANVPMPAGAIITSFTFTMDNNGGTGSNVANLYRIKLVSSPAAPVIIATATGSVGAGVVTSGSLTIAETVPSDQVTGYMMEINLHANNRLYGATVIYNTPDCRSTL